MPMSDVFAKIRNEYEKKSLPSRERDDPVHHKVLARNDACFITELPNKWHVDYDRRSKHQHTGFFAYNHVPYRTFGNLRHTDVYDLIGDKLGIVVQKHWHYMQILHLSQRTRQEQFPTEADNDSPNTIVVVCEGKKKPQPLPPSRNAGLSSIRVALGSNARVMTDMAAGSSFKETTRLEETRGKYLQKIRAPKEVKRNGNLIFISNPSSYLRPMVHTTTSKTCLVTNEQPAPDHQREKKRMKKPVSSEETDGKKGCSVAQAQFIALAAAQFKILHKEGQIRLLKKDNPTLKKAQRECLAKLKCVYAILCCLHNIRTKELRSKVPLSFTTVKVLSQKLLHSPTRDYQHDLYHHHLPAPHHHNPHSTHGKQRCQTWEDLISTNNAGDKSSPGFICTPSTVRGSSGVLPKMHSKEASKQEQRGLSKVVNEAGHKSQKVLPPWQRQVVFLSNKEEKIKRDASQKLRDCIESFAHFKSKMSQNVKKSLDENKHQLEEYLAVKLAHLDLGPNIDQCLDEMRRKAYQLRKDERDRRAEENNKPDWFVLLEKEVFYAFKREGMGAQGMLAKLKQFITVDNGTLPYALEKLCLLFMSLPAYYLSIGPVFAAVEFVTEHCLKTPPIICQQWRDMRNLPQVTTELPDPIYLFRQRV